MAKNTKNDLTIIGLDDGNYNNKAYLGCGRKIITSTRAKNGLSSSIGIGDKVVKVKNYRTEDHVFGLGDSMFSVGVDLDRPDTTDFPDYPKSMLNRVLVNHLINEAGVSGELMLATGLPVLRFYGDKGFTPDQALIDAKMDNLKLDVFEVDGAGESLSASPVCKVVRQTVLPEGFAAYYDYILDESDDGSVSLNQDRASETIAFIDFGGRSTDIVMIEDGMIKREVGHQEVSGSIFVGMLNFRDKIVKKVAEHFGIAESTFTLKVIDRMLEESQYSYRGQVLPIDDFVKEAKAEVAQMIMNDLSKRLAAMGGVQKMFCIGGGADFFKPLFHKYIDWAEFPDDGIWWNARGLYKYAVVEIEAG